MKPLKFGGFSPIPILVGVFFIGLSLYAIIYNFIISNMPILTLFSYLPVIAMGIFFICNCSSPTLTFESSQITYRSKQEKRTIPYTLVESLHLKYIPGKNSKGYRLTIILKTEEVWVERYWISNFAPLQLLDFLSQYAPDLAPNFAKQIANETTPSIYVGRKQTPLTTAQTSSFPTFSPTTVHYSQPQSTPLMIQPIVFKSYRQTSRSVGLLLSGVILGVIVPSLLGGLLFVFLDFSFGSVFFFLIEVLISIIALIVFIRCLIGESLSLQFTQTEVQLLNHRNIKSSFPIQDIQTIHIERYNYYEGYQTTPTQSSFISYFRIEVFSWHHPSLQLDIISSKETFPLLTQLTQQHPHLRTKLHYHQNEEWESYLTQQFQQLQSC